MKIGKEMATDILRGDVSSYPGYKIVESGDWISKGKFEYCTTIFGFEDKFYSISDSRSGSYHSEYYYASDDWPEEVDVCEMIPVERVIVDYVAKQTANG